MTPPRPILFLDRDGTIIVEPPDTKQIDSFERLEFIPGAISALASIARTNEFDLVMVTNQDGLGTASFPEESFRPAHGLMMKVLAGEGVRFQAVHIDRSFEHENAPTRKPRIGMLERYLGGNYDLARSIVIGDRLTDLELAKNLGARAILFGEVRDDSALLCTNDWGEIARVLTNAARRSTVTRTTKETSIRVALDLDSTGKSAISTGLGFFDHMLDQLARHSGIDLEIAVQGDLHIDEHHTIEDTALALGEALARALGSKRSIGRYGFVLPMDECLAQVAVDISGRPKLVWDVEFKREKIGEMPTEMFPHFFESFAIAAGLTLNIRAEGANEHHKIESIFKALARTLKQAVARTADAGVPSTKGVL